jgi:hypothetical protein
VSAKPQLVATFTTTTTLPAYLSDWKLATSIYPFEALDIDEQLTQLKDKYAGKVVVVVNVASL